ncbi:YdeI/OmpD-associated family protein [Parafrigoribacterium soli]|uniref:YdeI/OmpD-associated family protein n=1 Tax=Parafrigoribacterium soli TaxID=3144663 RepID=UPI0032EADBD0
MGSNSEKELLYFHAPAEWEQWLGEHFARTEGVRLKLRRKNGALPGMSYAEALDVALCYGWIDGQVGALDDDFHLQVFSPRRPRSTWSQINRDHVARLVAEGRMRPSGQAAVDAAKADGRWDAAYRQATQEVPDDLQRALDLSPAAASFFATLSAQNRFAILLRIASVKREQTRAAKIATYVAMLERGETLYPQKG